LSSKHCQDAALLDCLDQRSRAGQKITAGDIGTTFNPEVSQNTMFPLAEAFASLGELMLTIVPGPTGGGRASGLAGRMGRAGPGAGGCFVADTLVVMVRPTTADMAAATIAHPPDETSEDENASWEFGLGATFVAVGFTVGAVYVWRRTRSRRLSPREQVTDTLLADNDLHEIFDDDMRTIEELPIMESDGESELACTSADR
jgi:hypothetical protein